MVCIALAPSKRLCMVVTLPVFQVATLMNFCRLLAPFNSSAKLVTLETSMPKPSKESMLV